MSTWDERKQHEYDEKQHLYAWRRVQDELRRARSELDEYFYDPDMPPSRSEQLDYESMLFLLPDAFVQHPLAELLKPLPVPELPKIPELPPFNPKSASKYYSEQVENESTFRFISSCEKRTRKARLILPQDNFENKIISHQESLLIHNLLKADEVNEFKIKVEECKKAADAKYREAEGRLNSLKLSLETENSIESNSILIQISHQRHYLPSFLRKDFFVAINRESQTLLIQFEFPDYSHSSISYSELRNGNLKYLTPSQKNKAVKKCLYSLIIRAGCLAAQLNFGGYFQSIVVNVEQNWFDPATGNPRNGIIASLQASTEYFKNLDLSKLDPEACFKNLKGLSTPSLETASPIRPIFVLNKEDKRFIESKDLNDTLVPESNLAAMEWDDFEHLVAQLFEWEFAKNGVEVKVTRASRDRGVDAILFDPDPLRGGKFVLQAKRYTRTVDVSSVRDLYGAVMNEGANKGILITTSNFGPDSYEFAKDKPLSLVNGQHLLLMLQKHGKKFRIDLEEARRLQ